MTPSASRVNPEIKLDLARLLRLRLVVARHGEMDVARWWNTQGVLGRRGAIAFGRGFPSTHYFAQARVVFAVARSRCHELFDPPGCMTLWTLPVDVEDQFAEHWQAWLNESTRWTPFFDELAKDNGHDLLRTLAKLHLVSEAQLDAVGKLRRSAENRAVPLPGTHQPNDEIFTLLAAGFARGEPGNLAIPYARLGA